MDEEPMSSKMQNPITPGEILLEEYLKPMGISQNAMAVAGLPRSHQRNRSRQTLSRRRCPYALARSSVSPTSSGTASRSNGTFVL